MKLVLGIEGVALTPSLAQSAIPPNGWVIMPTRSQGNPQNAGPKLIFLQFYITTDILQYNNIT